MYDYNFGKMNCESAAKVAAHFNSKGATYPSTASDIGVSGSFMSSLVQRGYAKVVDHRAEFIHHNGDLYRKVEANVYVLTVTASDFWRRYTKCVENECNYSKSQAESYVAMAKAKLEEVESILAKVSMVRI